MTRLTPWLTAALLALWLAGCGSLGPGSEPAARPLVSTSPIGNDIAFYALGLIDTGYRFGGKNPSAGLDCSGMVSHVYQSAAGLALSGSAADMARHGKAVDRQALRPGDLVFFNTLNRPYSHVGIYIGDQRFVHAPSTNGRVRIDHLDDRYYAQRYESARTYLE